MWSSRTSQTDIRLRGKKIVKLFFFMPDLIFLLKSERCFCEVTFNPERQNYINRRINTYTYLPIHVQGDVYLKCHSVKNKHLIFKDRKENLDFYLKFKIFISHSGVAEYYPRIF